MADYTNIQVLQDGPRNVIVKLTGILDTADVTATTLLDPASLSKMGNLKELANRLAIKHIRYSIEDGLSIYLYWDATTDVLIAPLEGENDMEWHTPLVNTEASGVTGIINYATQGWSSGAKLAFALEIHLIKYLV